MLRNVLHRLTAPMLGLLFAAPVHATSLLFEVRELTDVAPPFSRNVYACLVCTVEDFDTVVPPAGFEKAPGKLFLPTEVTADLPAPPEGTAASLDLVAGIPGDEFVFVAQVVDGELLGIDPTFGFLARAQVQRTTVFRYAAGEVVHYVTDPDGFDYVLQAFALDLLASFDVEVVDGLAGLGGLPSGWSYSSELLEEDLVVASNGLASVFTQGQVASWQRLVSVPEPSAGLLVGLGALGLVARARARA